MLKFSETHNRAFIAIALFFSIFFLYISFLSTLYNFDGIACAIAIELGIVKFLFHGNHLIYGFIGYLFHGVLHLSGLSVRSVYSLQIMNCVIGSCSIVIFFKLASTFSRSLYTAVLSALGLAFSFSFWVWHSEAQVYPLGFVFLIIAAYILFNSAESENSKKYYMIGIVHALGCMGHITHLIWMPVVVLFMYRESSNDRALSFNRNLCIYIISLVAPLVVMYVVIILFVLKLDSISALTQFLAGSAGLTGSFTWPGYPTIRTLGVFLIYQAQSFVGFDLTKYLLDPANVLVRVPGTPAPMFLFAFTAPGALLQILLKISFVSIIIYGLMKIKRLIAAYNKYVIVCMVWVIIYMLFFSSFEPENIPHYQVILIPLWIIILCIFELIKIENIKKILFSLFILILLSSNFVNFIVPLSNDSNNHLVKRMDFIKKHTGRNDLIVFDEIFSSVYVPYFTRRVSLNISKHRHDGAKIIQSYYNAGSRIFVYSDLVHDDKLQNTGLFYKINKTYPYNDAFSLIEIIPREK